MALGLTRRSGWGGVLKTTLEILATLEMRARRWLRNYSIGDQRRLDSPHELDANDNRTATQMVFVRGVCL